ncbi:MAG: hypothetical protein ABJB78_04445, partial [Betaproteobacteria bacterium]
MLRPRAGFREGARRGCCALAAVALTLSGQGAAAATLDVGPAAPYRSVAAAAGAARDGDTIEIAAGTYREDVAVFTQKRLTIRGVGGRVVLDAAGRVAEGKAIFVLRDGDYAVEGIEFRGARADDQNGAGIRLERGKLAVRRCTFADNENGILTGNDAAAELRVVDRTFGAAPATSRLPHLLYVGRIARFMLVGSRLGGGRDGHLVKSRASFNDVRCNQLVDGVDGRASYELEFPDGGVAFVVGNIIGQGPDRGNPTIV